METILSSSAVSGITLRRPCCHVHRALWCCAGLRNITYGDVQTETHAAAGFWCRCYLDTLAGAVPFYLEGSCRATRGIAQGCVTVSLSPAAKPSGQGVAELPLSVVLAPAPAALPEQEEKAEYNVPMLIPVFSKVKCPAVN